MNQQPEQDPRQGSFFEDPAPASLAPLRSTSTIITARGWYARRLEQDRRPRNTVTSYLSDLALFAELTGNKRIDKVTSRDVARFLGEAQTRSTRKRRLTTLSGFFKWLAHQVQMIDEDPTAAFYPDHIPLKTPHPLTPEQQEAYLEAALGESTRTGLVCWLLLRLGLTRAELLALRPIHIEPRDDGSALIFIRHESQRARGRERAIEADADFGALYQRYLDEVKPRDRLIDMLPQSVNKLTDRVARLAGIEKSVSPQTLRDTFAVNAAREGLTEPELLALLGLADDHRNRDSVQRYLRLAGPAQDSESESV